MKRTVQTLAAVLVGAGVLALGAGAARCADDEFCAMSGTLVKAEVVKDKALEWAADRKGVVKDPDADTWSALVQSKSDNDVAVLVNATGVFFGVAGRGGQEVEARDAGKAFGRDLGDLKEAVKKEMSELWKADAVKIDGGDVQPMSDAAGLGTLEKSGNDWALTTQDCVGLDLDASELK